MSQPIDVSQLHADVAALGRKLGAPGNDGAVCRAALRDYVAPILDAMLRIVQAIEAAIQHTHATAQGAYVLAFQTAASDLMADVLENIDRILDRLKEEQPDVAGAVKILQHLHEAVDEFAGVVEGTEDMIDGQTADSPPEREPQPKAGEKEKTDGAT